MCGIAGLVHTDGVRPVTDSDLKAMCNVLRHRGPDDEGYWTGDGAGLGMRRLSIIDVAGGHQPISNETGTVQVVLNGEIYNFSTLRAQLEKSGHHFTTHTDTEVIAHAYEKWGLDCIAKLVGMFGLALWDRQQRRLVLARDRFGEKPLFYYQSHAQFAFASELKALLLVSKVPRRLNICALDDYLALGYISGASTIFEDIYQLPPAHFLVWEHGNITIKPYWNLSFDTTCRDDEQTALARIRELIRESVKARLMSDVPLGALLSGGIDSSTIVAFMAQLMDRPVKTFSIGFKEDDFSELPYARQVAAHFGTEHHEFIVEPDVIDILPSLIWACDQPFADASIIPTYYVSKLAREHVTVALSGDGGDELFGGYRRYLLATTMGRMTPVLPSPLSHLLVKVSNLIPEGVKGRNYLRSLTLPRERRYVDVNAFFIHQYRAAFYTPDFLASLQDHDSYAIPMHHFTQVSHLPFSTQMQYVDTHVYLPDDILTKVDRASMAVSLETRAPFLDPALAEYVVSLPAHYRINRGRSKYILKKMLRHTLPDTILNRPKMGFGLPIKHWLRGKLRALVHDTLGSQTFIKRSIFAQEYVAKLMSNHEKGTADNSNRIWALLCFEIWAQQHLDAHL